MATLKLHQPDKYRIFPGDGLTIGFCTAWNEPELVLKRLENERAVIAILGTLYSRQGVNIILRNLALNPTICHLVLWANGPLSNTEFGQVGWKILKLLWENGLDDSGVIGGTTFKIDDQIDQAVIEKVRTNVELHDLSSDDLETVKAKLVKLKVEQSAYMESVDFPEAKLDESATFPSEEVGWLVRGNSIVESWQKAIERIMRYGTIKGTQYGYKQRELIGLTWVSKETDPSSPNLALARDWPTELAEVTGATAKSISQYHEVFLSPVPPEGVSYTYGNRLRRYPHSNTTFDQIQEVLIKQLKSSIDSRRAVATTMIPSIDKDSKEPPCITQIQVLQSNGRIHLLATVRSHDMFKAAIPNAFGLRTIQQEIVSALDGLQAGFLQITSQSAHIYEQDWENASKLVKCAVWERPPATVFNPLDEADPRGNLLIRLENNQIVVNLQGPQGEELFKLEGATAKEVGRKLGQLDLLSNSGHYLDIGSELAKAEIALKNYLDYIQDRPLSLIKK